MVGKSSGNLYSMGPSDVSKHVNVFQNWKLMREINGYSWKYVGINCFKQLLGLSVCSVFAIAWIVGSYSPLLFWFYEMLVLPVAE